MDDPANFRHRAAVSRRSRSRWIACCALLVLTACERDHAREAYFAALRGEEQGMTREQQIALLDRAIAFQPKRSEYWETRGTYRTDLRQWDLALSDLERAIALHDRPYLRHLHGLVLCQTGRYLDALTDFDEAIERQPSNTQFYRGRSLARSELHEGPGALADARVLIARAPQQAESHYAMGRALVELGKDTEAITEFDLALAQRPELAYPLAARAECNQRLGHAALADADRRAAQRVAEEQSGCAVCRDPFRY